MIEGQRLSRVCTGKEDELLEEGGNKDGILFNPEIEKVSTNPIRGETTELPKMKCAQRRGVSHTI